MALDLRDLLSVVAERRIQVFLGRVDSIHTGCAADWGAVSRNLGRARHRWFLSIAAAEVSGDGPIRTEDGEISDEPIRR